MATMIR